MDKNNFLLKTQRGLCNQRDSRQAGFVFARDTISLDMPLNISILALETGALFVGLVTGTWREEKIKS